MRLVILFLFLGSGCAWAQAEIATQQIQPAERAALFPSKEMLEQGEKIAASACADCHSMDGISTDAGMPHLAGQRAVYLYRVLHAYQNGYRIDQSMGHASGFLNEDGLLSVAAYYASLPPAKTVITDEEPAAELSEDPFDSIRPELRKCSKCHEDTGNSDASGMPNLTAQDPEYFATSMQAYVDGGRSHKMMKRLVGKLDEATIARMGVYYAVQDPLGTEHRGEGDEASGRRLAEDCATCHGDDGNAKAADMPTLAGQDAKYFVKAMNAYLDGEREHEGMFEAVSGLSESDFQDLASFYAARTPAKRDVRAPLTANEWIDRCERCHGIDGNNSDPRFPMLAGQDKTYLKKSLQAYAAKVRNNSTMFAMAAPLSESDIEHIVNYYASQEPKSVIYMQLPCEDAASE
jgi:cytochrome c553